MSVFLPSCHEAFWVMAFSAHLGKLHQVQDGGKKDVNFPPAKFGQLPHISTRVPSSHFLGFGCSKLAVYFIFFFVSRVMEDLLHFQMVNSSFAVAIKTML